MSKFIHADLIAQYLEDANETDEPWLRWQYLSISDGQWYDCTGPLLFSPITKYRRKPKTILINGFEVPEPVREPLKDGQEYWLADTSTSNGSTTYGCMWRGDGYDYKWLDAGLIHLTKEAAQIHIDALLSFTRRDE